MAVLLISDGALQRCTINICGTVIYTIIMTAILLPVTDKLFIRDKIKVHRLATNIIEISIH